MREGSVIARRRSQRGAPRQHSGFYKL